MIDTHAHLHDPRFDEDRAATIARARSVGVGTMITVGTDLADSERAVELANEYDLAVAVGIHPHEAAKAPEQLEEHFATLIKRARRLVAIGEIGLDYYYDHSPREQQRRLFRVQLELAARYNLPVIIHEREAFEDTVALLTVEQRRREAAKQQPLRGVIHCFTRDRIAAQCYHHDFGFFLGIGGVVTFNKTALLREAIAEIGLDALLLETDSPYLAPVPHRGQRNEPAYLDAVVAQLAILLDRSPSEIVSQTSMNARRCFGERLDGSSLTPPCAETTT